MIRLRKNSVRNDRGAVAVEFGLLLPLLLLILFGIIDFGFALHAKVTLAQAAREGARLEALGMENVQSRAVNAAAGLDGAVAAVTGACPSTFDPDSRDDATVVVTYQFTFVTPVGAMGAVFGGGGYGDPIELTGRGVMPCEPRSAG